MTGATRSERTPSIYSNIFWFLLAFEGADDGAVVVIVSDVVVIVSDVVVIVSDVVAADCCCCCSYTRRCPFLFESPKGRRHAQWFLPRNPEFLVRLELLSSSFWNIGTRCTRVHGCNSLPLDQYTGNLPNDSANHNLMQRCTTVLRPCAVVSTSACVASNNSNCSLSKH